MAIAPKALICAGRSNVKHRPEVSASPRRLANPDQTILKEEEHMLRKLCERMESEKGFTLIELLVVILIIGILAAIALPAFLSQREKGQDADAKSNARNLVTAVESCYADTQDYQLCESTDTHQDITQAGLKLGTADGEVSATSGGTKDFAIVGHSKSGNSFTITKTGGAAPTRSCSGDGGCNSGSW
jgi:type IV pilus assembly protein PilA